MLKKRFRYNLFRKYEEDITGNFIFSEKKANKILKVLFMALLKKNKSLRWMFKKRITKKITNILTPLRIFTYRKRKKITYKMLIEDQKQKLNIYYGIKTAKQAKDIYLRYNGVQKNTMLSFLCVFEGRIDIFLYKMGIFKSIKFVRLFLKTGVISINSRVIDFPNFIMLPNLSNLEFNQYSFFFFRIFLYNKLFIPESFFYIPKYHHYDFLLNEFRMTKRPSKLSQIKYPFKLNGNILISWLYSNF